MNEKLETAFVLTWTQITKNNLLSTRSLFDELGKLFVQAFLEIDESLWKNRKSGQSLQSHLEELWQRKVTQIMEYLPQSDLAQGYNVATMRNDAGMLCGFASFVIAPVRRIFDRELSRSIGSILQLMLDEKIDDFTGDEAYVDVVAIGPEYQRKGLGSKLIFSVFEKYSDVKRLYLYVDQVNEKAQKFYEHLGFEREETFLDKWGKTRFIYVYSCS